MLSQSARTVNMQTVKAPGRNRFDVHLPPATGGRQEVTVSGVRCPPHMVIHSATWKNTQVLNDHRITRRQRRKREWS